METLLEELDIAPAQRENLGSARRAPLIWFRVILSTGNGGEVMRAASITLAGVPMRGQDVLDLARLLHDAGLEDTADALVVALEASQGIVALSNQDREAILRALDDPQTDSLASFAVWSCASKSGGCARGSYRRQSSQPGLDDGSTRVDACGGDASEERRPLVQSALVARRIPLLFSIQGEGER